MQYLINYVLDTHIRLFPRVFNRAGLNTPEAENPVVAMADLFP